MCEPMHSINQYPDDPETGSKIEAAYSGASIITKVKNFAKKIGGWLQFSMMGKGHSESIAARNLTMYRVAEPTRYEALWWNRGFERDGTFNNAKHRYMYWQLDNDPGLNALSEDAFEAAKIYAERVSIGNLGVFRRFFEASVTSSERPEYYLEAFQYQMLNKSGQKKLDEKIRKVFGLFASRRDKAIPIMKMCLGLSRKRELLVPEWADDDKVWQPGMA